MPTRYVVVADLHTRRSVLDRNIQVVDFAAEVARRSAPNPAILVFLGDLVHDRVSIHSKSFLTLHRKLREMSDLIKVYVKGNHDCPDSQYDMTVLETLWDEKSRVVTCPRVMLAASMDHQIGFLPYWAGNEIPTVIFQNTVPSILFSHCAIVGAKVGPEDRELVTGVPIEALPEATLRVLGHHHKHQYLDDHTLYVGAPFPVTFGEAWEDKGLLEITVDDEGNISHEFIPIPDMPKFFDFHITSKEELKDIEQVIPGNRVRVVSTVKVSDTEKSRLRGLADDGGFHFIYAPKAQKSSKASVMQDVSTPLEQVTRDYILSMGLQDPVRDVALSQFGEVVADSDSVTVQPGVIEPLRVKLTNFGPYASAELDLQDMGLTLLEGVLLEEDEDLEGMNIEDLTRASNGAGKSWLIEAVLYACFDETLRVGKKNKNDVIKLGEKDCRVEFDANIRGKMTHIVRGRPKFLEVTVDGVPMTDVDLEPALSRHLGMDMDTALQVMILGQRQRNLLFYLDLDEAAQKAGLDAALGLTKIRTWLEAASKRYDAQDLMVRGVRQRVEHNEGVLGRVLDSLDSVRADASMWEDSRVIRLKVESAPVVDAASKKRLSQLRGEIDRLEHAVKVVEEELASNLGTYESSVSRAEALSTQYQVMLSKLGELAGEEKAPAAAIAKLKVLKGRGDSAPCPECGQDVPPSHIDSHISDHEKTLKSIMERKESLNASLNEVWGQHNSLAEFTSYYSDRSDEVPGLKRDLTQNKLELSTLQSSVDHEVERQTARRKQIEEEVNPYSGQDTKLVYEVEELSHHIETDRATLQTEEVTLSALAALRDVFGFRKSQGVRFAVYSSVQDHLNSLLEHYSKTLSDGRYITQLTLVEEDKKTGELKDKFGIHVFFNGGSLPKHLTSGGQQRRLNLAFLFSFRKIFQELCGVDCKFLAIDEVFDSLDGEGVDAVANLLPELLVEVPSILAISHDSRLHHVFQKRLFCLNTGGFNAILTA